jgi:hypothetical protein
MMEIKPSVIAAGDGSTISAPIRQELTILRLMNIEQSSDCAKAPA